VRKAVIDRVPVMSEEAGYRSEFVVAVALDVCGGGRHDGTEQDVADLRSSIIGTNRNGSASTAGLATLSAGAPTNWR
jgi:hypothetical protein